ncbi:MAG: hypothetical protein SGI72_17315 [Planctomycetota bacterium]|nr:hypothetical protein [Planctomycetota bacterium]
MYETALIVHNLMRWVALAAILYAFLRACRGWMGARQFGAVDKTASLVATIVVDVQFTLGLLLYIVWSPQVKSALSDMGAAMKNPELRYWAVEHAALMVLVVVVVHVGKVLARKAKSDGARHRRTAIFFGIALVLILARMPWPGGSVPRPWFRF